MELNISLLPWQERVWADPTRFAVIAAGRRCGKTRYAAYRLLVEALGNDVPFSHIFYVAETQRQAKDIMWSMLLELGRGIIKAAHINDLQVTLINGSTISLKGSDRPDTMRGVSLKYCVMDEYGTMKPEVWEEILRPALADLEGGALFIGTPKGRNHFWELYQYAELSGDPEWKAYHLTSYDNPTLKEDEINKAKKSMSSYAFRQEFMASFEAKESELFKEDWLVFADKMPANFRGDCYIAIDPAGFAATGTKDGGKKSRLDETAIAIAYVNEDGWYVKDIIHGRWDLKETARKIFNAVAEHKPVAVGIEKGIAQQAIVSPLTDLMRQKNRYFRLDLLSHGNQKKTDRIVWALQGRMENKRVTFEVGDWNATLMDQLFQFPSKLTHDDLIDALSYIDQLAEYAYPSALSEVEDWEPLDDFAGY